jgi:hypothetical protein
VKHARFTPDAVVEFEDAVRRVDRARPGWGDKLNDEVLEALERIEEYVEGWQIFDERGPERRFVLDRFPCIVVYVVTEAPGVELWRTGNLLRFALRRSNHRSGRAMARTPAIPL